MTITASEKLEQLGRQADARGFGTLSPLEQDGLLAWSAYGSLTNNGARWIAKCVVPPERVADSFRKVGLTGVADAVECITAAIEERVPARVRWPELLGEIDWNLPVFDAALGGRSKFHDQVPRGRIS